MGGGGSVRGAWTWVVSGHADLDGRHIAFKTDDLTDEPRVADAHELVHRRARHGVGNHDGTGDREHTTSARHGSDVESQACRQGSWCNGACGHGAARAAQTSKSFAKSCASARGGRATQPWRVAAVQGGLNERTAARPTHDPRVLVPAM